MNNYICIGKIINTFGIKGELKIISDFEFKDRVFKKDIDVYIGEKKQKETINTHRIHKNYDLVLLNNYCNINEILKYKGNKVYVDRNDLSLNNNEYLLNDLIGFEIYDNDKLLGIVIDYEKNVNNVLLKIKGDKNFYIPFYSNYIKKVDVSMKQIITNNGSELIL